MSADAQAQRLLQELALSIANSDACAQLAATLTTKTKLVQRAFVALICARECTLLATAFIDADTSFQWEAEQNYALRVAVSVGNAALTAHLLRVPGVRSVLINTRPHLPKQTPKQERERRHAPDPLPMIAKGPLNAQVTQLGPGWFVTMMALLLYNAAQHESMSTTFAVLLHDPLLLLPKQYEEGQITDALACGLLGVLSRKQGANFNALLAHPRLTATTLGNAKWAIKHSSMPVLNAEQVCARSNAPHAVRRLQIFVSTK